jgi:hypothetical protein
MFYNDEILFMAVELKYCERCGGLHVRRSNSEAKFCSPCMDGERAVVEQVFRSGGKRSGLRSWFGSVGAVLVAAEQSANAPEIPGGAL